MSDGIYIDHSTAASTVHTLTEINRGMRTIVEDLKTQLATQVENWIGTDKDVYYNQVIPAWNSELNNCDVALSRVTAVLEDNSVNLRHVSAVNAQSFQDI